MPPHASDTPVETSQTAHADEVVAALKVLRGIGMKMAQGLVDEPADAERRTSAAEAALAYSRISRAVRLTCVLELRVAGEAVEQRASEAKARREAERLARVAAHEAGYAAKQDAAIAVGIILQEAKESGQLSEAEFEPLSEQLEDWSEDEDHEVGFEKLSQAEIFEAICQALDITPDPALWAAGQLTEAIEAGLLPRSRATGAQSRPSRPKEQDHHQDTKNTKRAVRLRRRRDLESKAGCAGSWRLF